MDHYNPTGSDAAGYAEAQHIGKHIEEFRQTLGIEDFAEISSKKFDEVQKLAGEGTLNLEQLSAVIPLIPRYVELQKESIETLKSAVEKAGSSQITALEIIRSSLTEQYRILGTLANAAESDATRIELAELTMEVGKQAIIIESMNRDNNVMWQNTIGFAAGVAAGAVGVVGGVIYLLARRGGSS